MIFLCVTESYSVVYSHEQLSERGVGYQTSNFTDQNPTTLGFKQQPNLTTNSGSTTTNSENSSPPIPLPSPPCLRWAQSLHMLLQDPDGVKLFQKYLYCEGKNHADALDFWFACEGLKKEVGIEKIHVLVKVIYK